MKNHSYHLLDPALEKGTGHREGINGPAEAEGDGNRDGSHQGCRMWATVPGEVIMVEVDEVITEVDEEDTEGNRVEEEDMEDRTEEMDHRVKVDGSHAGGMMDHPHLVDLDLGVRPGGNEALHLRDVDHLVHPLDVENLPHPDEGTIHLQLDDVTTHPLVDDVLTTHHLDELRPHEGVGTTIPRPGVLGTIHLQLGGSEMTLPHPHPERSETIPPHLENPKRMIRLLQEVEMIHDLAEQLGEIHPGPDPGRDHLPSLLLLVDEGVRAGAGVEQGHHHRKSGEGGVLPRLHPVLRLRMPKWISQMGMGMAIPRKSQEDEDSRGRRKRRRSWRHRLKLLNGVQWTTTSSVNAAREMLYASLEDARCMHRVRES